MVKEISSKNVFVLAKKVKSTVESSNKLPSKVVIDKNEYNYMDYAYIFSYALNHLNKNITLPKKIDKATNPYGDELNVEISKSDYLNQAKRIVEFINDNKRCPSAVATTNRKKSVRTREFIYFFAKILSFYEKNKRLPSTCLYQSSVFTKKNIKKTVKSSYPQTIYDAFVKTFGKVSTIDEAFNKVKEHGYSHYFDDTYTNLVCISRLKNKQGINCTDACQLFYNIAKVLGYDVKVIHVKCSQGDGHVRLQLRHTKHTKNNWINRDPACIISKNGKSLRSIWCENAYILAVNPSWFMENVYK